MKSLINIPVNKNYLIGRECDPTLGKKQYEEVGRMTRALARAYKQKPNQKIKINIFTSYNPSLLGMNTLIKKHLLLLHNDGK